MLEPTEIVQLTPHQVDYLKAVLSKNRKTIAYLVHHLEENNLDASFCNSEEDITEAINILSTGANIYHFIWTGLDFAKWRLRPWQEGKHIRRMKNVPGQ